MPRGPQETQSDTCVKRTRLRTHFWKHIAHPADFFQETGGNTKKDAHEKTIGGINRRDECFQQKENGQDQNGRNEKCGVPPRGKLPPRHAGEKVPYTVFSIYDPRESNAGKTWPEEHSRKHQDTGQLWQRLVAHEMRCGYHQGTYPRDRERQYKVAGDRMASDHVLTRSLHRGTITQTRRFGSDWARTLHPHRTPHTPIHKPHSHAPFRLKYHAKSATYISRKTRDPTRQYPRPR